MAWVGSYLYPLNNNIELILKINSDPTFDPPQFNIRCLIPRRLIPYKKIFMCYFLPR